MLLQDHKPENDIERRRIEANGGLVVAYNGPPRVVWNRPRGQKHGAVSQSKPTIDRIPFLAIARSLGELIDWYYIFLNLSGVK